MRFTHKQGSKKTQNRFFSFVILAIAVLSLCGGLYLLTLVLTPNIPVLYPVEKIDPKTLPVSEVDRIYIPKIGVNVAFRTGGEEVLNDSAWHRYPERGDPVEGGNFIISAHRFEIGLTPSETRRKSPFYHVDKLAVGDQIIVDFKGVRYGYEITEKTQVKPTQVEIESTSEEPRLTLYSCTLKGESDGREVFFAKPLGEVVDGNVEASI